MKLVMLDIDGTLTQSYDYDQEIFGRAIGDVLGSPPIDANLDGYKNKTSLGVTQEAIRRTIGRDAKRWEIEEVKRLVLLYLQRSYQKTPEIFVEIPGAKPFLNHLLLLDGVGVAIATGCWLQEAIFKTHASGLEITRIPMATSDDHIERVKIMAIAADKAKTYYQSSGFENIVYIGDGPWDMQFSCQLGYSFIGIGPRVHVKNGPETINWHPDFLKNKRCSGLYYLCTGSITIFNFVLYYH